MKNEKDGRRGGGVGVLEPLSLLLCMPRFVIVGNAPPCTFACNDTHPPLLGRFSAPIYGNGLIPYIYLQILLAMLRHWVGMFVTVLKGLFNLLWQYELRKIRKCCNFSHSVYRILLKNWFFSSKVWTSLNILIGSILNTNTCFMLVHGECECDVEIHVMVRMKSFN